MRFGSLMKIRLEILFWRNILRCNTTLQVEASQFHPLRLQNWCGVTKESWCGEDYPPLHCQTTQSINGYNGQLCVEARSTIYLILTYKRKNLLNFKIITRLFIAVDMNIKKFPSTYCWRFHEYKGLKT